MTLNYKPIKIIFYVKNYYVRDWQCHLQQYNSKQYKANINSVPVQTKYYNFTLHHLSVYTIYSKKKLYIRNSYTYQKMLVNPMYDS